MQKSEYHPIASGFIPENTKTLVVGTFPPKDIYANKKHYFFYASAHNHFWNRMENIFKEYKLKKTKNKCTDVSEEQNKTDKQKFAEDKKIGFLDVFTSIARLSNSTKDEDLIDVENIVQNGKLNEILTHNKNIVRICCTYKLAFETLKCRLPKDQIRIVNDNDSANNQKIIYEFGKRITEIYLLYPATRSRDLSEIKDAQYEKLLFI
ncbi:MAG: hypothetical protein IPG89_11245 [Bacteroidetes bacterium]|nr:hypothetical protein [Bacteroidota bacterium]